MKLLDLKEQLQAATALIVEKGHIPFSTEVVLSVIGQDHLKITKLTYDPIKNQVTISAGL